MTIANTQEIRVNGETVQIAPGTTLGGWLSDLGKDPRSVAIELDGAIVPRSTYDSTVLEDGAKLELVQFVQGG